MAAMTGLRTRWIAREICPPRSRWPARLGSAGGGEGNKGSMA